MMYIEVPDPHPGRCKNYRNVLHDGEAKTLRCLNYEAEEHICEFPKLKGHSYLKEHQNHSIYTNKDPEPWVKPNLSAFGEETNES